MTTPLIRDDICHAVGQTLKFYGKDLEPTDFSFWWYALRDSNPDKIKQALKDYIKVGKFAPRPKDVLELIENNNRPAERALPPPSETTCPPDIARAWMWFIGQTARDSENFSSIFDSGSPVTLEQQERYLHVVNHEAHKANMPEAIQPEFRLQEVWG